MFIYQVTTAHSTTKYQTFLEQHSTPISANRVAYLLHKRAVLELNLGHSTSLPKLDNVDWTVHYSSSWKVVDGPSIDLRVNRVEIRGPDLSTGELDVEYDIWVEENAAVIESHAKSAVASAPSSIEEDEDSDGIEIIEGPALKKVKLAASRTSAPSRGARTKQTARKSTGIFAPQKRLVLMQAAETSPPIVVYEVSIKRDDPKWPGGDTQSERYSTMLSANRAAYLEHRQSECYCNDDRPFNVDRVKWGLEYYSNFSSGITETSTIEVDAVVYRSGEKLKGPDLFLGEKDPSHEDWVEENEETFVEFPAQEPPPVRTFSYLPRTKQTCRKTTGGKAPRKQIAAREASGSFTTN